MTQRLRKRMNKDAWLVIILAITGILVRVIALEQYPVGINQDEAYSAYEAMCLLHDGMDSWGYRYPVYLTVWGSGQSALQSYLMTPMIALLGPTLTAIRLPQAINACLSLFVIYRLLRHLFDKRTAVIGLAFLAICPWHIMMSRWGLDCNFAPGLILMGMYLFIKGVDEPKYLPWSGFVYGLCLYAYATIWVVMPFLLLAHAAYYFYLGRLKITRHLIAGTAILGLMAFPLLLFLVVNWKFLPEISTPWFSIPRMAYMRGSEITLSNLLANLSTMAKTFFTQSDTLIWNASEKYGLFYHLSLPFMLLGCAVCTVRSIKSLKNRVFDGCVPIFVWLLLGIVLGCMIDGNINRLNFLHMPLILCIILGIAQFFAWMKGKLRVIPALVTAAYALSFVFFLQYYFTSYQDELAPHFDAGLDQALTFAQSKTDDEIFVSDQILFSKVLFYDQIEPEVFRDTVWWRGEIWAYTRIDAVDRYRFGVGQEQMLENVCIVRAQEIEAGIPEGVRAQIFDTIAVLCPQDLPSQR